MSNSKKRIDYWWDYSGENRIVIESSHPDHPIVKVFYYKQGQSEKAISEAESLIERLERGNISLKAVLAG